MRYDRQLCWCVTTFDMLGTPRHELTPNVTVSVAWFFLVAGSYMMTQWAVKKHRNYKKEFGNQYPKNRKALFPFIL